MLLKGRPVSLQRVVLMDGTYGAELVLQKRVWKLRKLSLNRIEQALLVFGVSQVFEVSQ